MALDTQGRDQLTLKQVEGNDFLLNEVRESAAQIMESIETEGFAMWVPAGWNASRGFFKVRDFALRVLIAKKMIKQSADDHRVFYAA